MTNAVSDASTPAPEGGAWLDPDPAAAARHRTDEPWLVALDIDGTIMLRDGTITAPVREQITRLRDEGHEVMLATGRAVSMTIPVAEELGIDPEYLVCSNGAVIMRRDHMAPLGFTRAHLQTFNPTQALMQLRPRLQDASFAVEDERGHYRYVGDFPNASLGISSEEVEFEQLLDVEATRLVVVSLDHDEEDFFTIVEEVGLHKVSYNIGWTAWLDIAPDGVNKATGMERVRRWLGAPASRVIAVGDGRNDIEMLEWASTVGRGVAMGQAPDEVKAVANELTGSDAEDGLASVLASIR